MEEKGKLLSAEAQMRTGEERQNRKVISFKLSVKNILNKNASVIPRMTG